jgi:hypothetical protein
VRARGAHQADGGEHVGLHRIQDLLVGHVERATRWWARVVGDHDVEPHAFVCQCFGGCPAQTARGGGDHRDAISDP